MATRKEIAIKAGKLAARAAYNAVMNAPVKKVASSGKKMQAANGKDVAIKAAKAAHDAILALAQGATDAELMEMMDTPISAETDAMTAKKKEKDQYYAYLVEHAGYTPEQAQARVDEMFGILERQPQAGMANPGTGYWDTNLEGERVSDKKQLFDTPKRHTPTLDEAGFEVK